ncbi:MAG: GNAT family N-acetyltransferase [Solobacterium sp.]|nr:GNAT family N-acetyltransferase [Solobacterium sp.]
MTVIIRKVRQGDADTLAYIQTESWKAAFSDILDAETLRKCTNIDRAAAMYQNLLIENKGNGYILLADGKPHCIAYWDAARDAEFAGKAELICIHSLPDNWHKGYGSQMMDRVLEDIMKAGYSEVVLWVFRDNKRARAFYEAKGFSFTNISKPAFDTEEVLYSKETTRMGEERTL